MSCVTTKKIKKKERKLESFQMRFKNRDISGRGR